jgi:hypothetical protein
VSMYSPHIVGCGTLTTYPVDILQTTFNNKVVSIYSPWVEKYQGTTGVTAGVIDAFFGIGVNLGYAGASTQGVKVFIRDTNLYSNVQGSANGSAKHLATVGRGVVEISGLGGDTGNIAQIVSYVDKPAAGGPYTSAESQARVDVSVSMAGKLFDVSNSTAVTNVPVRYATLWGPGAPQIVTSTMQQKWTSDGLLSKRDFDFSAPADYAYQVSNSSAGLDNSLRFKAGKRLSLGETGNGNAPASLTWDPGDSVTYSNPVAGGFMGQVCVVGGTQGAYAGGKTATADGSVNVVLSSADATIKVGQYLTINGVTGTVVNNSGTALTMSTGVTAGSGLAIAFRNATFKTWGAISP